MTKPITISVTGCGYVGLTIAAAFNKKFPVIAYDINPKRIHELKKGIDKNQEISTQKLKKSKIHFTTKAYELARANFHIVTVPTPIDNINRPDLNHLIDASKTLATYLKKNDIVVYESTVYPGATEEQCIPLLEKYSRMKSGRDFFVGYSPERINPGDQKHTFENTVKIVSGQTKKALEMIAHVYNRVLKEAVYPVSTIRAAEAAKVVENTQRDLNISLMNEIALILQRLNIDTQEVLKAASTKWNFIPIKPGLVGGHCIGVDPYYLTHKAQEIGYHPDVILAGRRINDYMGKFIAECTVKHLALLGKSIKNSRIAILGLTYKENCPDLRNTKVADMVKELESYGATVHIHDPLANAKDAEENYGIKLIGLDKINKVDALILAVAHKHYQKIQAKKFKNLLKKPGFIMDVKGTLNPTDFSNSGISIWKL